MVAKYLVEEADWWEVLKKLHMQFAHSPRLRKLLKNSGKWESGMGKVLKEIEGNCTSMVCVVRRRTRQNRRPVVSFPRADRVGLYCI